MLCAFSFEHFSRKLSQERSMSKDKLNQSLGTPGSRLQREANSCLRVKVIGEEHTCLTRGSDFDAIKYTYNESIGFSHQF